MNKKELIKRAFALELMKLAAEELPWTERHPYLAYLGIPAAVGTAIGVPLGIFLSRYARFSPVTGALMGLSYGAGVPLTAGLLARHIKFIMQPIPPRK